MQPQNPPRHNRGAFRSILKRKQSEKFSRYFLLISLLAVMVLFFNMVKMFLLPVVLGAIFATLFYPLYQFILHRLHGRRGISAFLSCFLLLIGFLIPLYVIGNIVSHQAVDFYQNSESHLQQLFQKGEQGPLGMIQNSRIVRRFHLENVDWKALGREIGSGAGAFLARLIGKTSGTALQFILTIFITFFVMFYFFRDGESLIPRLKYLIPLSDHYIDELMASFATVSRATIRGNLLIGLTQSTIGALTLWIFGVSSPILWWVVMLILSMIPVVGAWAVMHPAAIIQILYGNIWQGIGIFLVTILVISTIDNFMRPRLVGHYTGMHDLVVFFAALGGIRMFGPFGVIIGPVVAAFFVAILDIYSREFKSHLEHTQKPAVPAPVEPPEDPAKAS
jgi:predicted PurR-regulated permease PerM